MPDTPEGDSVSVQERIEELEDTVDTLEEEAQGKNQLEIEAYDISIKGSSEDTDMAELLELFSSQMDQLMKQALIGEYQELEERGLHGHLFGDD